MGKILSKNRNSQVFIIVIVVLVVVVILLLAGGGDWTRGIIHGGRSMGMSHLHWGQILIGSVIGFLIGLLVSRRK